MTLMMKSYVKVGAMLSPGNIPDRTRILAGHIPVAVHIHNPILVVDHIPGRTPDYI